MKKRKRKRKDLAAIVRKGNTVIVAAEPSLLETFFPNDCKRDEHGNLVVSQRLYDEMQGK